MTANLVVGLIAAAILVVIFVRLGPQQATDKGPWFHDHRIRPDGTCQHVSLDTGQRCVYRIGHPHLHDHPEAPEMFHGAGYRTASRP